jgi:hypothetical protein
MEDHVREVYAHFGDATFTTGEVAEMLSTQRLETWPPKVSTVGARISQQIGYAYRRASDRWYGDLMVVNSGRGHGNVKKWQIVRRNTVVTESGRNVDTERSGTVAPTADWNKDSTKPLLTGGDGGDGGNCISYMREKGDFHGVADEGRKASPPSPPSPPHTCSVGDDGHDVEDASDIGATAPDTTDLPNTALLPW